MNKKIIFGISIAAVTIFSALLFLNLRTGTRNMTNKDLGGKSTELSEDRVLHIVSLDWKPFLYEENGEQKGIGVEIVDRALKNLGVAYNLTLVPWPRALKLTETGEADAILAATHKEDRESYMTFTPEQLAYGRDEVIPEAYFLKLDYVLFLKRSNLDRFNFESINQLISDRYTIGVNQDFSYTPMINAADLNKVVHFSEAESFRALKDDEMDFFLASKEVGLEILDEMGLSDEITYLKTPVDSSYVFLIFSKNSKYPNLNKLVKEVDQEFIKIYENDEYDEIYSRYVQ